MITGRPLRVEHVRGGRPKPGLMRQHLTCLRAAVALSSDELDPGGTGAVEVIVQHHFQALLGAC